MPHIVTRLKLSEYDSFTVQFQLACIAEMKFSIGSLCRAISVRQVIHNKLDNWSYSKQVNKLVGRLARPILTLLLSGLLLNVCSILEVPRDRIHRRSIGDPDEGRDLGNLGCFGC
jgi:hypothetical protein